MNRVSLTLHPSEIAKYFELDKCPKYVFWLSRKNELERISRILDKKIRKRLKGEIDEVLRRQGRNFEESQQRILAQITQPSGIQNNSSFEELVNYIINKQEYEGEACIFSQPSLNGRIGIYTIEGRADIVLVRHYEQKTEIWVFEAKFTNEEKFHHRLQAIMYAKLIYDAVHKKIENQGRSLEIYVSVITKKNNLGLGLNHIKKLKFPDDAGTYVEILENALKKDGTFDRIITGREIPRFWISKRCQECPYEAFCIKEAVEKKGLELLGIRPGDQEILEELGISTLEDLADLYEYPPHPKKPSRLGMLPTKFEPFKPQKGKEHLVNNILSRLNIANLQKLAQGAYRLVRELNCNPDNFSDWIHGSGYNLPRDIYDEEQLREKRVPIPKYPSGSLIRVYIFVQYDPVHDRLAILSATVENTLSQKLRSVVKIIPELSDDEHKMNEFEMKLIDEFFEDLFKAIKEVRPNLTQPSSEKSDDYVFVHLYFYSRFQRDALMNAVKRHGNKLTYYKSIRWLLGLRKEIDQEMVSIIKEEISKRHALRFPGLGIIPVVAHYYWKDNGGWFEWDPEIKTEFEEIFKIAARKNCDNTDKKLILDELSDIFPDGISRISNRAYPVMNRELEQIPLKYLWEKIDTNSGRRHLEKFAMYLALAVRHIERSIPEWSKDTTVRKEPIPISELERIGFEDISLAEVLIEYQKLEYQTKKENMEEYYRLPIKERCSTGKSLLIKIDSIKKKKEDGREVVVITGHVPLSEEQEWNLMDAPISLSEDSLVVITPVVYENGNLRQVTKYKDPSSIKYSILGFIQSIEEYESKQIRISLKLQNPFSLSNYEFVNNDHLYVKFIDNKQRSLDSFISQQKQTNHKKKDYGNILEVKGIKNTQKRIKNGDLIVIDEAIDDINSSRAYSILVALSEGEIQHILYNQLKDVYQSKIISESLSNLMFIKPPWNKEDIREFIDRYLQQYINPDQRKFIEECYTSLVTLQGPPGTGKTSYAIAPAIWSRVYSALKQNKRIIIFVTGISHRAVNEALISTIRLLDHLDTQTRKKLLNRVRIYRLVNSSGQSKKIKKDIQKLRDKGLITFINYNRTKNLNILNRDNQNVQLIFGTTSSLFILVQKISLNPDLIVIDEASMMDLPMFLLATSFLKENGQVLLVGDHRQMQPIQQHDWEHEDRETIEQHTPFLSAINFIRFLRGELSESEREEFKKVLYRDPPLWEYNNLKKDILPFHRLNETYRLPQIVADMLTDLFYIHDNIELKSKKHEIEKLKEDSKKFKEGLLKYIERLGDNPDTTPIASVINPEYPVTLVLHDENKSTKVNEVEKIIISEIVKKLPKEYTSKDKLGIVVPFKAQRAQIKSLLRELGLEHVQVDTVERFQGGEKDIIIISLTASDPSYISAVLEFLFNPNRLNVAMSRMKEKLILIGSQEMFNATTKDIQKFEELIEPWRTLFRKIRTYGEKLWSGTLEEFVGELDTSEDKYQKILNKYKAINMEVFGINEWPKSP
ncbi:hypothetical protein A3L14_07975 [Thermococcus thioreducens]|uniref:DNA2/NAM7 helicase-like C-terminal domain-containing protein n=4 Tax=Thermococcus thioreducens TaxID=277988 RepID=A0A1I0MAC0_9EURY|nr:hypothetical protein A3L14_07975 [Thermococcus thioreducens]SEV84710.1 uncharacterized protein SAMN05216170_0350 [Thermococcus thioreducens]